MTKSFTILALAAFGLAPLQAALNGPVKIESGMLAGVPGASAEVGVFKGVPYAAPPVGDLRWRAPGPALKWQGVRKADKWGAACMQLPQVKGSFYQVEFYPTDEPTSEDCLFLNVYTAARSASEKRPVLVWIHGGALREGSGSLPSFDGEPLARKGLVVVTINYRMNVFGFFAHPELTRESGRNASGNYGFLDQIAALQWVHRNIAAFGGDPGNVTVDGQSAGSRSISCLMASPLAKGLFHHAMGQSGAEVGTMRSRADAEKAGVEYATAQGAHSIAELRRVPADKLLKAGGASGVIVDGYVLPDSPYNIYSAGKHNDVALVAGSMGDEHAGALKILGPEDFRGQAKQRYGDLASKYLQLYPSGTPAAARQSQRDTDRDTMAATMRRWARLAAQHGKSKVFMYYFDHPEPGRDSERYGAFHSGELVYQFDNLKSVDRPWQAVDRSLATAVSSYWANFIAHGDPNGSGLTAWPVYDPRADITLRIGDQIAPRPRPDAARLNFYDELVSQQLAHGGR